MPIHTSSRLTLIIINQVVKLSDIFFHKLTMKAAHNSKGAILSSLFSMTGKDYSSLTRSAEGDSSEASESKRRRAASENKTAIPQAKTEQKVTELVPEPIVAQEPKPVQRELTPQERGLHEFVDRVIDMIMTLPENFPDVQRTPRVDVFLGHLREIAAHEAAQYQNRIEEMNARYAKPIFSKVDRSRDPRLASQRVDPNEGRASKMEVDTSQDLALPQIVPSSELYDYDVGEDGAAGQNLVADGEREMSEAEIASQYNDISLKALDRILANEDMLPTDAYRKRWVETVCRLVVRFDQFSPAWHKLRQYIISDITARLDLAISWLYHEFIQDLCQNGPQTRYVGLFAEFLPLLPKDRFLLQFLVMAPMLPEPAFSCIRELVTLDTLDFALQVYEILVSFRVGTRSRLMGDLFVFSKSPDALIRDQSLSLLAGHLFSNPTLASMIVEEAEASIGVLSSAGEVAAPIQSTEEQGNDSSNQMDTTSLQLQISPAMSDETIRQHMTLFLGLCPRRPSLLVRLTQIYPKLGPNVRRVLDQEVKNLMRSFSANVDVFADVVKKYAEGAEDLVLCFVQIISDYGWMTPVIGAALKETFAQRGQDARFLIPVIHFLTKEDFAQSLPHILLMKPTACSIALDKLMNGTCKHVSAIDLVINLHTIDHTKYKIHIKKIVDSIEYCFDKRNVYTQEVLERILFRLLGHSSIPGLTMRTIIQAISMYPKLRPTAIRILQELVQREVWKVDVLWKGFMKCVLEYRPETYDVVVKLPSQPMQSLFVQYPELGQGLLHGMENGTLRHLRSYEAAVREALAPPPVIDAAEEKTYEGAQADSAQG
eukprot:TRINITY_DN5908_c0_g2_i1.p1 TRINITY_DN5908_c0_g2~~TRINITY_DN5908_c0_g2_i1.p1  ORF type:complete len:826 (+),score=178.94 TRINITY_DN5908_c0_g2_i1:68-2545(+)